MAHSQSLMKNRKTTPLQIITHIAAIIPLALLLFEFWQGTLGPDPIRASTLRTGKTALVLLLLSMACSPIYTILKLRPILRLRRPLGLYAFLYASIHLLIFLGLDYAFDVELLKDALLEKRYALVGLATFSILLPLAITSTNGWKRRLGKKWKSLHRLVYLAGVLAVVHFIWLVKQGVIEPWYYALAVSLLLSMRIPYVKQFFAKSYNKRSTIGSWMFRKRQRLFRGLSSKESDLLG